MPVLHKFETLGSHDRRNLQLVADLSDTVWWDETERQINQRGCAMNRFTLTFHLSSVVTIIFLCAAVI